MTDVLISWLRQQLDDEKRDAERTHYSLCSSVALRGPGHPCDCGFPDQRRAEVDAKRRILDDCEERRSLQSDNLVRLLALPYAASPGYREEWRV